MTDTFDEAINVFNKNIDDILV